MLTRHARKAAVLAAQLEDLEYTLLAFANQPESAKLLDGIVHLLQRVDGLRDRIIVSELAKVTELVGEVYRPAPHPRVVQQVAVVGPEVRQFHGQRKNIEALPASRTGDLARG